MSHGVRLDRLQQDNAESRIRNSDRKRKERARRDLRLRQLLQKGTFPYTPTVMSWLSVRIDKPTSRITPEDVAAYLKSVKTNK
jgi:hypothetical protein